jgi:osmoprotectant transport system ATP-binding protein
MQQGGHLAQYAPPTDLLLQPANDFVARFVGVDRGLKRLSLLRVADLPASDGTTARVGDASAAVRRRATETGAEYVLLIGSDDRPLGWMKAAQLPEDGVLGGEDVDASSPFVTFDTTLRDALSLLLASNVQTAVVVDERGRFSGVVELDSIAAAFRAAPASEPAGVA